jgi:hypothetical protein
LSLWCVAALTVAFDCFRSHSLEKAVVWCLGGDHSRPTGWRTRGLGTHGSSHLATSGIGG